MSQRNVVSSEKKHMDAQTEHLLARLIIDGALQLQERSATQVRA